MTALQVCGVLAAAVVIALAVRLLIRYWVPVCPAQVAWILGGPPGHMSPLTHRTVERLGLKPGMRVLEIGPGPGRLLIPAAQRVLPGGEVFGLDIQQRMIDKLLVNAAKAGVTNLTVLHGDATRQHFAPDSFDLIFLCTVIGEIPDRAAALRECHAALRQGGRLSITEMLPDPHYCSRRTVRRLAEAAGFRLKRIQGSMFFFTAEFIRNEKTQ